MTKDSEAKTSETTSCASTCECGCAEARTAERATVDGIGVTVRYSSDGDARVSEDEMRAYLKRAYEKFPHAHLESLELDVEGEDVGIHYNFEPVSFDRIRRITGYLVGTLDRFNDAKRNEEHDRVKHSVPTCCC